MKLLSLRPIIWTDNLEETLEFYSKTIGLNIDEKNEDWGWASLSKDDISLMIANPNEHTPFDKPIFTGSFYFHTDDVHHYWQLLKDKTNICYPLEEFEWNMREFAIYDNNGYILQFGEEME